MNSWCIDNQDRVKYPEKLFYGGKEGVIFEADESKSNFKKDLSSSKHANNALNVATCIVRIIKKPVTLHFIQTMCLYNLF
ncbi:unnamed protein product [Moneuplotes crassus]|uniref:Uncharacterized protein n=1 Tax=Euplotes crassus TaxID=5936 RepID=A0AAD1XZ27_EUPCR|nr:unnamed protein product [Moneuplotes crassus]